MIQLILVVFVVMLIYSFMRSKKEMERQQAQRDEINAKKNTAIDRLGLNEKASAKDKEDRVFILAENNEVYVFNPKDDSIDKIEGIKKISSKRRYATAKAGWATCTQLQDAVLKIELEDGEYLSEFDVYEVRAVEKFEELVLEELGLI